MNDKAELAWKLEDYVRHGVEPPEQIVSQPEACEGQLMSDDDIWAYIEDSIKTLLILNDRKSDRFEPVKEAFVADLEFLVSIDRLTAEEYTEITNQQNYEF
jgi:hypothetical protein